MIFRFMIKKNGLLFISRAFTLKLNEDAIFFWEWKNQHSITKVYAFVSSFPKAQIFCNLDKKWMWLRKRSSQRSYGFPSVITLSWSYIPLTMWLVPWFSMNNQLMFIFLKFSSILSYLVNHYLINNVDNELQLLSSVHSLGLYFHLSLIQ